MKVSSITVCQPKNLTRKQTNQRKQDFQTRGIQNNTQPSFKRNTGALLGYLGGTVLSICIVSGVTAVTGPIGLLATLGLTAIGGASMVGGAALGDEIEETIRHKITGEKKQNVIS